MNAVGMMQMARHEVIHVISVQDGGMAAALAMGVRPVMSAAVMHRSTSRRVLRIDEEGALVDVPVVHAMKVPVVRVVDVVVVLNGDVTALWPVNVIVRVVDSVAAHRRSPSQLVGRVSSGAS